MIEIKEIQTSSAFRIDGINYGFDKPISNHLLNHDFILPSSSVYLFCGKPKSGKSCLVENIFGKKGDQRVFRKTFMKIFYFVPPSSYHKDKSVFKLKPEQIFHELTQYTLQQVITHCEQQGENNYTAVIIDDMQAYLKKKEIQLLLNMLINNKRHLRCSLFLCQQNLKALHLHLRQNIDQIFQFKMSKKAQEQFHEEYINSLDDKEFEALCNYVFDKQYNFLIFRPAAQEFYKNFNRLEIIESNSPEKIIHIQEEEVIS